MYEEDGCDHTDLNWVTQSSLRYVKTMGDSQVRCLLYILAKKMEEILKKEKLEKIREKE